jgi:hypothetical protein
MARPGKIAEREEVAARVAVASRCYRPVRSIFRARSTPEEETVAELIQLPTIPVLAPAESEAPAEVQAGTAASRSVAVREGREEMERSF